MYFIILSTLLACSTTFLPTFITFIVSLFMKDKSNQETKMELMIMELRKQQQNINMVDEFPAYAKLQRKITSLTEQSKNKGSLRQKENQWAKYALNIFLHILTGISCLWFVWSYRDKPVITLPENLLWPITSLLAFPSCRTGEVSIIVWMGVVRTSIAQIMQMRKTS